MQVPFHPLLVHLPLALSMLLPVLIIVFAYMIKTRKMSMSGWLIIIGLQVVTTVSGYIALESGENEEHLVAKVVDKKIIHEHEEKAEIFVGTTVIALVLSLAVFFLKQELQFLIQMGICIISLVSAFCGYRTGQSGGELVYVHGASQVYSKGADLSPIQEGILPTPGMNTSESQGSSDENESLKSDDNDYGNGDSPESDEEEKQED